MKKLLVLVLMVCFALIGCSGSGGGSSKKKDPCAGPVPCLSNNWGDQVAVFYEGNNLIALLSDGEFFGIGAYQVVEGETVIIGVGGEVINCYYGNITVGSIDYDLDGIPDYWFDSVSGGVKVCDETLRVYNIVIEGEAEEDVVATFDSMATLSASNHLSTDAPISAENVEKTKILIKLLEQLMEE